MKYFMFLLVMFNTFTLNAQTPEPWHTREWLTINNQGVASYNCTSCAMVMCLDMYDKVHTGNNTQYSSSFNYAEALQEYNLPVRSGIGVVTCIGVALEWGTPRYEYMPNSPTVETVIPQEAWDHAHDSIVRQFKTVSTYDEVYSELQLGHPTYFGMRWNLTANRDVVTNYRPFGTSFHSIAALDWSSTRQENGKPYLVVFNPWGAGYTSEVSPTSFQEMLESFDGYGVCITDVIFNR